MSGILQRKRNVKQKWKQIKAELGELREEPTDIHLYDFNPGAPRHPGGIYAEDSPHITVTKDGHVIRLFIHSTENPYRPENEAKKKAEIKHETLEEYENRQTENSP